MSKDQSPSSSTVLRSSKRRVVVLFSKTDRKLSKQYLRRPKKSRRSQHPPSQSPQIHLWSSDAEVNQRIEEVDLRQFRNHHLQDIDLTKLDDLSDEEADDILHHWPLWARPNQLEPEVSYTTWLILAGRGFGKTRTGAETIIKWVREGICKRIALVAEDSADARDVMVEGESGILACSPRDFKPKYEPSKRRLTWPNGAVATLFSAEDYDSLRGPQFDGAWCDELCKWRYAQEAWDNLQFGLRLGDHPKQIVTTTPRPMKLLKDIILRSDTFITKGNTRENLINLAPPFVKAVIEKYEGTRIGRQELNAELLDDVPGALWNRSMIEAKRIRPADSLTPIYLPDFLRIVVAVDPAKETGEGAAETGIVVVGVDHKGQGYVLQDASMLGSPEEWGTAAVRVFDEWEADHLVYEANQGGEMVAAVIRQAAKSLKEKGFRTADYIPMKDVHATRGKYVRAEPVSQLYEQGRVSHVGSFPQLEDQMCEFTQEGTMGYSPDRLDALVWALTELMVGVISNQGLMDYMRQESEAVANRIKGILAPQLLTSATVPLQGPPGINTAYGGDGRKYMLETDGLFHVQEVDVAILKTAGFLRHFPKDKSGASS